MSNKEEKQKTKTQSIEVEIEAGVLNLIQDQAEYFDESEDKVLNQMVKENMMYSNLINRIANGNRKQRRETVKAIKKRFGRGDKNTIKKGN